MKKVHTASPSTPCTHHDYVIPCHIQSLTQHLGIVGSMLEMCSSIPLPSANAHPLHLVQMLTINANADHKCPSFTFSGLQALHPHWYSSPSPCTGLVYMFTTAKLQLLVTQPEGKNSFKHASTLLLELSQLVPVWVSPATLSIKPMSTHLSRT